MIFQPITEHNLTLASDIVHSNPAYNILENGNASRSMSEIRKEFLNGKTESYLIIDGEKTIGVVDFLDNNPRDNHPWIGFLMIKKEYQLLGCGKRAYEAFEKN
ncbi:GNAT family N-acetyltransferase [Gracilibacillus salinarum]|uniref:GNAT family N-acetyltransferase n=1 Tax=Gracilibacillus salinarum TaxID=2932255 RepID=A0ABY4GN46_9BACI|nr:GNAT family N-acetyltransferase [Gracilibacillus salinarum]UOQ84772.1 GNAT family N-acetyltransferase [Gracilibacillus salinarum]